MKLKPITAFILLISLVIIPSSGISQERKLPKPPLSQEVIDLLVNEISGQIIYNNEVILAGAPWIRDRREFSETLYEAQKIYDMARSYGIETIRLNRYKSDRKFDYPFEGEFWIIKPKKTLVARIEADVALIARSSSSIDVTGELIYLSSLNKDEIKKWEEAGVQEKYKDKIALMWSQPKRAVAKALDAAGIKGVISFNARDRYFDPDQVVYSRGSFDGCKNLKFGFTLSWRQWSEILEDLENGHKLTVRCKTRIEKIQDKFEDVFCWIPGVEPDKKGIIFTGHLFEGYTKRGANDNISGCVVQLEILRALSKLISTGTIPQPRRTIYFLWPNEISGTYEHFVQNPGFAEKLSSNINMDMVGEGLRKNNAKFTLSETPNHLPCYLDGLGRAFMNYVWRTNDIVYLPDSPRGRSGQVFPAPMWEKNGSRDAFRFFIHRATGGSDHTCFNNPSIAVPGIELNVWPDQWYHADTDTPDKSDPTQMKRVAFIGAAMVWVAANCTDVVLDELLDAVSSFGYERVAKRELANALRGVSHGQADDLQEKVSQALNLIRFAVERETGAVHSVEGIYTGTAEAKEMVTSHTKQWQLYGQSLEDQILKYGRFRAGQLNAEPPGVLELNAMRKKYTGFFPSIHEDVKGKKFYPDRTDRYKEYMKKHPDFLKELELDRDQQRSILNFIDGKRSITKIHNFVIAETEKDLEFEKLNTFLEFLKEIGWISY